MIQGKNIFELKNHPALDYKCCRKEKRKRKKGTVPFIIIFLVFKIHLF